MNVMRHVAMLCLTALLLIPFQGAKAQTVQEPVLYGGGGRVAINTTAKFTSFGCYYVTNHSPTGLDDYVPLTTADEWNSFVSKPPPGVTISACPAAAQTRSSGSGVVYNSGVNYGCSDPSHGCSSGVYGGGEISGGFTTGMNDDGSDGNTTGQGAGGYNAGAGAGQGGGMGDGQ